MSSRLYKMMLAAVAAVLLLAVSQIQWLLVREREALGLNRYAELKGAPPVLALTTVALGGFRGLISNALWIRATDLQDQDKFFEMVQLADWITKLEPHFTQVWATQGWNMAFNISVKFKEPADRWRWVERGIQLLRDDGLRYNPYDVLIHRELGWIFQFKMGGNMDDAQKYYKWKWANEMREAFGGDRPNWEELINPQTGEATNRVALLTNKYKLQPQFMKKLDDEYGPLEWRLPEAHAMYWAAMAMEQDARRGRKADPDDVMRVRREIYQSMMVSFHRGRLIWLSTNSTNVAINVGPNLALIPNVNKAFEKEMREAPEKNRADIRTAHRNFLLDAVYYLHINSRETDAIRWYKFLAERYPDKPMLEGVPDSLPRNLSLDEYAIARIQQEIGSLPQEKTRAILEGLETQALISLAVGDEDRFLGLDALAQQIWRRYAEKITGSENRLGLPPLEEMRRNVLQQLLNSDPPLQPELVARLATFAGRTNLPSATPKMK